MTLTLQQAEQVALRNGCIEERLFELFGGWVKSARAPSVKLLFDSHSRHAAWRCEQWTGHLGALGAGRTGDANSPDMHESWPRAFEVLEGFETDADRLAGSHRILLSRLLGSYSRVRRDLGPPSSASLLRTLERVENDAALDRDEGEWRLQALLDDGQLAELANRAALAVELAFLGPGAGGGGRESNPPDGITRPNRFEGGEAHQAP